MPPGLVCFPISISGPKPSNVCEALSKVSELRCGIVHVIATHRRVVTVCIHKMIWCVSSSDVVPSRIEPIRQRIAVTIRPSLIDSGFPSRNCHGNVMTKHAVAKLQTHTVKTIRSEVWQILRDNLNGGVYTTQQGKEPLRDLITVTAVHGILIPKNELQKAL